MVILGLSTKYNNLIPFITSFNRFISNMKFILKRDKIIYKSLKLEPEFPNFYVFYKVAIERLAEKTVT